jgi:phage gp45-like
MWISRNFNTRGSSGSLETGTVTMSSNGEVEAVSSGVDRLARLSAPFGYSFGVPQGQELVIARLDGEQVAIGTVMQSRGLDEGEIMISSPSGAYIRLCTDGSVIINGLVISREGVIND